MRQLMMTRRGFLYSIGALYRGGADHGVREPRRQPKVSTSPVAGKAGERSVLRTIQSTFWPTPDSGEPGPSNHGASKSATEAGAILRIAFAAEGLEDDLDGSSGRREIALFSTFAHEMNRAAEPLGPVWKFPLPGYEERLALLRKRGLAYFSEDVLSEVARNSTGFSMAYVQEIVVNALLQSANNGARSDDRGLLESLDILKHQRRAASKHGETLEDRGTPGFGADRGVELGDFTFEKLIRRFPIEIVVGPKNVRDIVLTSLERELMRSEILTSYWYSGRFTIV